MANREKNLPEKIQELRERKPEKNDVIFCVGRQKKIIGAVRIVLEAASTVLEKEFEGKWETAVVKDGKGIPLPDFDPEAFQVFVKLTTLDTWSVVAIEKLKLPVETTFNLLTICQHFQLKTAIESLEVIVKGILQSFWKYKNDEELGKLSQANLKTILASDDLGLNELEVQEYAISWAWKQCYQKEVESTQVNMRQVLGSCLYEIRYPIMSNRDFTRAIESSWKSVLTAEEKLAIYKLIGTDYKKGLLFPSMDWKADADKLPFKTTPRMASWATQDYSNRISYDVTELPFKATEGQGHWTALDLTQNFKMLDNPAYVCEGKDKGRYNHIQPSVKVALYGFGFCGPVDADSFYDVKVKVFKMYPKSKFLGQAKKRIWAPKGKTFQVLFDKPIVLMPQGLFDWGKSYEIDFFITGPDTWRVDREMGCCSSSLLQEDGVQFKVYWGSTQMAEVLFKKL